MEVTRDQIQDAVELAAIAASLYSPANVASIALLAKAAKQLNALMFNLRDQTDAEAKATWKKAAAEFKDAMAGWDAAKPNP